MKKNITSFILGIAVITSGFSQTRYVDEVFGSVDVTTDVVYGQNFSVLAGTPIINKLRANTGLVDRSIGIVMLMLALFLIIKKLGSGLS